MLYRQPHAAPFELDLAAVGLKSALVATNLVSADGINAATGKAASIIGSTLTAGQHGVGRSFAGNTFSRLEYPSSTLAQTKFTAMAVFVWRSGAANNFPQLCSASAGNSGFRLAEPASSGGGQLGLTKGGVVGLNSLPIASGVPYAVVTSHDQASGDYFLLLRNLVTGDITSTTQNNTAASTAGDGKAVVGNGRTDFAGAWNGDIFACAMAFEYITRAQGEAWLRNPWAIFADPDEDDEVLMFAAATGAPATAGPSGVTATASVGVPVARGAATASPAGVATAASVGTVTARGAATASPAGLAAVASVGTASASGATTANATPTGVSVTASVGQAVAAGAARAVPAGVGAAAAIGTATSTGAATAQPSGVTATATTGQPSATAGSNIPGTATPAGVGALATVGAAVGNGAASCTPAGVTAFTSVGAVIAAGSISIPGTASPLGVTAYGRVGTAMATGGGVFARAPAGPGFAPHRNESQSRPAATQGSTR